MFQGLWIVPIPISLPTTLQMQQHANKLQRAKEEAALKAMRRLLPDMSPTVWVLALEECNWDVEPAVVMLNTFKAANSSEILRIQKVGKSLSHRNILYWCFLP